MAAEKSRTELVLPDDLRMIPAVGAAIHHVAAHSGMSPQAESALRHKAEDVCAHALPLIHCFPPAKSSQANGACCLHISVLEFADRVEVVLEHPGQSQPAGKKRGQKPMGLSGVAMGFASGEESEPESSNGVDRVLREPLNGRVRVTLVQYCRNNSH